jgi:outer membrane protein assembly factor BamB
MKTTITLMLFSTTVLANWPSWRGPGGTGAATDTGATLVDDPRKARMIWKSADEIPGARVADGRQTVPKTEGLAGISGGFASPVVADGRIYLYYYIPNGKGDDYDHGLFKKHDLAGGFGKEKWWIDCDDVIHCFDAATGKTLWKRVFAGKGMNFNLFNKGGPCNLTPTVHNGKVFAIGGGGKVYCLDARTGAPVWDSNIGERHERQEKLRAICKQQHRIPQYNRDFSSSPVVAGGVVVGSDFLGYKVQQPIEDSVWGEGCGMIGLDAKSGKLLWHHAKTLGNWNSPVVWTHDGKEYVIGGTQGTGTVTCVEAATGKVMWQYTTGQAQETLVVSGAMMAGQQGGSLAGFRISPDKCEKVWSLPSSYGTVNTPPVIYKQHVYAALKSGKVVCVELASGKMAGEVAVNIGGALVAMDGRIFGDVELGHDGDQMYMFDANPRNFKQLGGVWPAPIATVYMNPLTPACSGGQMILRSHEGRLVCYELRADKAHAEPQVSASPAAKPKAPAKPATRPLDPTGLPKPTEPDLLD